MNETALQVAKHVGPSAAILQIPHGLTETQKAFCDYWLLSRNGTESARKAGYKGDDNQLAVQASTNLRLPKVKAYIEQNLKLSMMSADEVLRRLSKQGRADISDILTDEGEFDFKQAKQRGNTDLIKKLRIKKTSRLDRSTGEQVDETTHELELHNAQTALELMGKHHHLFEPIAPTTELNISVNKIELVAVLQSVLNEQAAIDVTPEP